MAVASLTVTQQYALLRVLQNTYKRMTKIYTANGGFAATPTDFNAACLYLKSGLAAAGYPAIAAPAAVVGNGNQQARFASLTEHCAKTLYVLLTGTGSGAGIQTAGPTLDTAITQLSAAYAALFATS